MRLSLQAMIKLRYDSIAFALNNIKGQVSMLSEKKDDMRVSGGAWGKLFMTLEQCHMKKGNS